MTVVALSHAGTDSGGGIGTSAERIAGGAFHERDDGVAVPDGNG